MTQEAPSICLVANELYTLGPGGGIGSSRWRLAHLLARHGWRVHVLHCAPVQTGEALEKTRIRLQQSGIGLTQLDEGCQDALTGLPGWPHLHEMVLSERVRLALETLEDGHAFDLVVFTEWQALGLRTIQAKRAGMMLKDAGIIVSTHSMSQWMREGGGGWPGSLEELRLDACEREAFDLADFQLSPTRYMLDYARSIGWNVREEARVVRNALPSRDHTAPDPGNDAPLELVFFGRLERRKGLEIFIEAVRHLDMALPITFLGRDTVLRGGEKASDLIHRRLQGRSVQFKGDCNREEALQYLANGNRLAVMPSLLDNYPNTVQECAVNGIPFLTSCVGGIPEMLEEGEVRDGLLFEPVPEDLRCCMQKYLSASPAQRREWRDRARELAAAADHDATVVAGYARCLEETRRARTGRQAGAAEQPLVTVGVTHYHLGQFLAETLAAVARQTYGRLEVLVIDDGSTDAASQKIFDEQEKLHPTFRFLRQSNTGVSGARNALLSEARGEFFLPVDADDLLLPEAVERLTEALVCCPDDVAAGGYYFAFESAEELASRNFRWAYRPIGGSLVLGGVENIWGGATILLRTAVLRSFGGYACHRENVNEDWDLHARLAAAGHRIGVVPCLVLHYRLRSDSRNRTVDLDEGHRFMLQHALRNVTLAPADQLMLWESLTGFHKRMGQLEQALSESRDALNVLNQHIPPLQDECQKLRAMVAKAEQGQEELRQKLEKKRQEAKENREKLRQSRQALGREQRNWIAGRWRQFLRKMFGRHSPP